jgi:hypothetical protein
MTGRSGVAGAWRRRIALWTLFATIACSSRSTAPRDRGPFLSIMERDGPAVTRPPIVAASMALALGSLPPEELPRLREHLRDAADAILRRSAPDLFDLEGDGAAAKGTDPPPPALPGLPALTAATNILGSPWDAPGISVRLGPKCEVGAARCVPLFAASTSPDEALVRRGRALAWALANAALIRAPANARPALLGALHAARRRPDGTIAMVFGMTEGTLEQAELAPLRDQARQSLEQTAAGAPLRAWLEVLAAAPASWKLPVDLQGDEVLVVPRLGALARLKDFASEVQRAGSFEWIAGPGAVPGK